jgi:Xaa-Pro aminopeptidase
MKAAAGLIRAYLQTRQASVRRALAELKLDGILLTHPPDLAYLSDFTGDDSIGLLTGSDFFLVTDFRYQEQARLEAPWLKVNIREGKMAEALAKTVHASNAAKIGFEANFTPFGSVGALEKELKELQSRVQLVPVEDVLVNIRKVKDDVEIDLIRQAVAVAEEAYTAVREQIKPGQTENYLAGLMGFELRCRGASDCSFPVIVAAGPASSLPHYRPGESLVKRDQFLLIDWGARFKGYCSDLTRTLAIGRVSTRLKKAYNIVLDAQKAAIDFLRPGVTTRQADRVARDVIEKAGFGDHFGHGLGHGIGRDIHELPTMRKTGGEEELRPGMIVTVEPGVYLPGEGGVRIEDDVLITHGGREVLSSLDKSFEGCHLE